jgi:hypothetical protein
MAGRFSQVFPGTSAEIAMGVIVKFVMVAAPSAVTPSCHEPENQSKKQEEKERLEQQKWNGKKEQSCQDRSPY